MFFLRKTRDMETKLLTEKYHDQLKGELNCYDRIIITGSLQPLCYAQGMTYYLYQNQIRIFDYATMFAEPLTKEIRENAERIAKNNHIQIDFIRKKNFRQEDKVAEILKDRGTHPGLVHIFGTMEQCISYKPWHDKESGKTFVKTSTGKCLHYYFYFIHVEFGLCFFRMSTWSPFSVEFYCNGHNWLAGKLTEYNIPYELSDNAFTKIADFNVANRIAAEFDPSVLHHELDALAREYCPPVERLGLQYRWSIKQVEYATDLVFKPGFLSSFYPTLAQTLSTCVQPDDISGFLGHKLNGNYIGEITTRLKKRPYCICIKHRMGPTTIKMYDKFGLVLRIETTTNDVSFFRAYREVVHRSGISEMKWAKMKKSIYSLVPLQQIALASNYRYLQFISAIETPQIGVSLLNNITKSKQEKQHSYKGFNLLSEEDNNIFRALVRGEFAISGFTHKALYQLLPDKTKSQIGRLIKRLHVHGLIKKVAHRYKYYISELGRQVAVTVLKLRDMVVVPVFAGIRQL